MKSIQNWWTGNDRDEVSKVPQNAQCHQIIIREESIHFTDLLTSNPSPDVVTKDGIEGGAHGKREAKAV